MAACTATVPSTGIQVPTVKQGTDFAVKQIPIPDFIRGLQVFTSVLDGGQETPPVVTDGTGFGGYVLNEDGTRFAGTVTFRNLSSPVIAAHIHQAPVGQPGPIVKSLVARDRAIIIVWTANDPTEPLTPALVEALRAGNLYVNIHTQQHPGGEIRGQIFRVI
jgi:hypothetical protein